jgi:hypothetical protein
MNKISVFVTFMLVLIMSACSTSKEARKMKSTIEGEWLLQSVNIEGIQGRVNAKVFNEANYTCFEGSSWKFIQNISIGSYSTLSSTADCPPITRQIKWTVFETKGEPKQLQFKRLDNNRKEIDNGGGFRLDIISLNNVSMQLRTDLTFEGKSASIVYNFTKI